MRKIEFYFLYIFCEKEKKVILNLSMDFQEIDGFLEKQTILFFNLHA